MRKSTRPVAPLDIAALGDAFMTDGYCVISQLIPAQARGRIFTQIETLLDTALRNVGAPDMSASDIDSKYGYLEAHAPVIKSHCYDAMGKLDSVVACSTSAATLELGHRLFGTPLLVDFTQIRIDTPTNDRLLPLHQELGQISLANITVWTPLTDTNATSGGLQVVPGSHVRGRRPHVYFPELRNYHGVNPEQYDPADVVTLEIAAGDGVIFHPHLLHGSLPNRSTANRWTLVTRLNELTQAPYLADPNAPLHVVQHDPGVDA